MTARLALVAVLLGIAGCAAGIGGWSAASTTGAVATGTSRGRFEGRSCRWFVFVPFGLPQIDEAIADAVARGGGTSMRDVSVVSAHPLYGPVGKNCYVVKGEVVG